MKKLALFVRSFLDRKIFYFSYFRVFSNLKDDPFIESGQLCRQTNDQLHISNVDQTNLNNFSRIAIIISVSKMYLQGVAYK